MGSTLTVQNIQGPTSGANANKIIIPAGHTLDASAGFVPPAGSILQVVNDIEVTQVVLNTTTYSSISLSVTITPKYGNSLFLITGHVGGNILNNDNGFGLAIIRNGTNIHDHAGQGYSSYYPAQGNARAYSHIQYMDTPSTTSPIVYEIYGRTHSNEVHFHDDGVARSYMTVMEIKQ